MTEVLIVGPGAVGGTLAARWSLARAADAPEVLLLGRSRASEETLARRGLDFEGPAGLRRGLRRGLFSARSRAPRPCAAAFLCVKAPDLPAAARSARPWIGPETAVVSLQNGVGHERLLRRAFGPRRTVIGSSYLGADRPSPRRVSNTWGNRILLAQTRENRPAVAAARGLLRAGGWRVEAVPSEGRMLWTKLCFNAATNPLGALCAVPNGGLAEDPALRQLMLDALAEAVKTARRAGHAPLYPDMAGLVLKSCREAPVQRNSMLQDLQAGRRTEVDAILGPLLSAARRTGTPVPLLSRLAAFTRRLEKDLRR